MRRCRVVAPGGFPEFRDSIQRLGGVIPIEPEDQASIEAAAAALQTMPRMTVAAVANLIEGTPEWIPVLGLCARLSREQLRGILRHRFGTESGTRLARDHSRAVVELLDREFNLLTELRMQRRRKWSFADVLLERFGSRLRAGGAIGRGRKVEDLVEAVVRDLGLPHQMRTRFAGRGGETAPCDLAIPGGGKAAVIVCAVKPFDSTGSKLTDAAQEIARMADVRLPSQYVFAVVDGLGWLRRQSDLKRIHDLFEKKSIDGLYTISGLSDLSGELRSAARRAGIKK